MTRQLKQQLHLLEPYQGTECVLVGTEFEWRRKVVFNGELMQIAKREKIRHHGPQPFPGAYALHTCHNKYCMNPNHIYWGTQKQNMHDKVETILTDKDVLDIRLSAKPLKELAEQYGVSKQHICNIQKGGKRQSAPGPIRKTRVYTRAEKQKRE